MIDLRLTEQEKKGLTDDEIELAKARKLEILMLPHLRRHINFFYAGGNLKGKAKAYREQHSKEDFERVLKNEDKSILATVCKPLCTMVAEILKENGIKAETVSCDTDLFKHTDVLIKTKSGNQYIINFLEDMEMIQTGMKTPDFASRPYYDRRYKKFEGSVTTDGKSLESIEFISEDRLDAIDSNLHYKQLGMYMNSVIEQIKAEFADYRKVMAENEWLDKLFEIRSTGTELSEEEMESRKNKIFDNYAKLTDDEVLESKLDWIFNYFNDRMDIHGYTDFVMYYSRLLLKEVLSKEEYSKITRYDGFVYLDELPPESRLLPVLDIENPEEANKSRFSIVKCNDKYYMFSTKPNSYIKIDESELEKMKEYIKISESTKPSDLMLFLCDKGNALPLVFHPLGSKLLNERAALIDSNLTEEQRRQAVIELSRHIQTMDEPITCISIPYPDGTKKLIYINENDEFVVQEGKKRTIFHYNEKNDTFEQEFIEIERE